MATRKRQSKLIACLLLLIANNGFCSTWSGSFVSRVIIPRRHRGYKENRPRRGWYRHQAKPQLVLLNLLRDAAGQTTEFRRKDVQDFQEKQSQNQARKFNLKASLLPSHFPLCALLKKMQNEINQRESASLTDCLFPISSSLQSRMFLRVLFSNPAAHYPDAGLGWLDK